MPLLWQGGGTDTKYESAHKDDSGEEILLLLLPGFEIATFQSQVVGAYQQANPTFV